MLNHHLQQLHLYQLFDHEKLTPVSSERKLGDSKAGKEGKDAVNDATSKVIPSEVRFTCKEKNIYAFIFNWYQNNVLIKSLTENKVPIENVTMLGHAGDLKWSQTDDGLAIEIPASITVGNVPIKGFMLRQK